MRRYGYGQFHLCEDASQEALLAAALQWPSGGLPDNPRGWLVTVAARRLTDQVRSEQSRRAREEQIAIATPPSELLGPPADAEPADRDDSLALLFGCCHPDLSAPSQIALTLRAVGGLSTAQIAAAFGVPEPTMAQRISRAKQTISGAGFDFTLPSGAARTERLRAVLHVLYLVFSEGYTASEGDALTVPALSREAIRLTRWLHRLLPDDGEVTGLLALMLLTDARRAARTVGRRIAGAAGRAGPAAVGPGDDRRGGRADQRRAAPGRGRSLPAAGGHRRRSRRGRDDGRDRLAADPRPLRPAGARRAESVHGAQPRGRPGHGARRRRPASRSVAALEADKRMARHHRLLAVRAHLRELAGDTEAAAADYLAAARRTTSLPERRYLALQASRLTR